MPVVLAISRRLPGAHAYRRWCRIGGATAAPDPARALAGLAERLERAFDEVAATWLEIGRTLGGAGAPAHAPVCAPNASDLGLMLAWAALVEDLAGETETTLVVCDDPWMYRHLAGIGGVRAGRPPPLWPRRLALALRGLAARQLVVFRMVAASIMLGPDRRRWNAKAPDAVILVYGHPDSAADGADAYFGSMMHDLPGLRRVLHVDCPPGPARRLSGARTASLHGWGSVGAALGLMRARWRPGSDGTRGRHAWLVRRAAAIEGATGQAAMIRWQGICQESWLRATRPGVVAWPWENHAWERDLVRRARALGIRTVGYQHTVVGARELNYSAASNADGLASIPDLILASGEFSRDLLVGLGHDPARIGIGGALRFHRPEPIAFERDAPVFMALPFEQGVAAEMVAAARELAARGRSCLVRAHPMTPYSFDESVGVRRCETPLQAQKALSAVVYAGTSVGLEAVLRGIPTVRFQPCDGGPVEVVPLPTAFGVPVATAEVLQEVLSRIDRPPSIDVETIFSTSSLDVWAAAFGLPIAAAPSGAAQVCAERPD